MAYELKDGQGTLFKNDKDGNDKRPDYRGELMLDGTLMEVAGWIKEGKRGKWVSLSVKPKEERPAAPPAKPRKIEAHEFKDDIPF